MGSSTKMNTGSNGSSHHHHLHHHNQRGSSGRSYGLMLLLAFGAAILGVMILHKLREGRLFSLLVKEKDHELLSLHFLLQREREFNKEARKKIQDLNTKLNSLQNEKMEIDHRLSGTEYMVASMREDNKALESQLDEKQQEIEKLRSEITTTATADQDQQQQRIFKRMETDTEDVQQQSGVTQKVWSVSSDDPSSNAQAAEEQSGRGEEEEQRKLENSGSQIASLSEKNNTTHEDKNEVSQGSIETTISTTKGGQMMRRDGEETETGSQKGSDLENKLPVPLESSSSSSTSTSSSISGEGKWREIINTKLQKNGYSDDYGEEHSAEQRNDDEEIVTTDSEKKHPAEQNDSYRGSKWRGIISNRFQKHGYSEQEMERMRKENEDVASSRRRRMRNRFLHILKPRKNHNSKGEEASLENKTTTPDMENEQTHSSSAAASSLINQQSEQLAGIDQDNRSSGGDQQQQQMHSVMTIRGENGEEFKRKQAQLKNHLHDQASVATLDEKETAITDQLKDSVAKKGKKDDSSSIEEDQHQNSHESSKEEDLKDRKASGGDSLNTTDQSSEAAAQYEESNTTRGTAAADEMEDLIDEHDQYKSKDETEID